MIKFSRHTAHEDVVQGRQGDISHTKTDEGKPDSDEKNTHSNPFQSNYLENPQFYQTA